MKIFWTLVLFAFVSCTIRTESSAPDSGFENRVIKDYYQSSGVGNFILPYLPAWASFSSESQCFRKSRIRFLNLEKVMDSYQFSYREAVLTQKIFNQLLEGGKASAKRFNVGPQLEEQFFYTSTEKVSSKIEPITELTFNRLHLIWIDSFEEKDRYQRVARLINSRVMDQGRPLLFSLCETEAEIRAGLKGTTIEDLVIPILDSQYLTPYGEKGALAFGIRFPLGSILGKDKKYIIFREKPLELRASLVDFNFTYHQ